MLALVAAAALAARAELPIAEVDLSDGTRRFAVTLTIGGTPVRAGLDTGSVGLRLLPSAAAATEATAQAEHYSYGAGTSLDGVVARAPVAVDGLAAIVRVEAVHAVGCTAERPGCPARRIPPARFGIQGNGLPGEGFPAILGTALAKAALPNPLVALGAHRWIVTLPRPDGAAGRLILNPRDEETAGFVTIPLADRGADRRNDAVAACLTVGSGEPICAPTLIDSGAPGIEVVNHRASSEGAGGSGTIAFGPRDTPVATIAFPLNSKAAASRLEFVRDERVSGPRIRSGLVAYFADDVLYDADAGTIAVRPRPPYAGGAIAKP